MIIAAIDRITHAAEAKAAREIGAVGRNRRGGAPNEIEKMIKMLKLEPVVTSELRAQVDVGVPPEETIRALAARISRAISE